MAGTGGHFGPESVACFAPEWVVAFSGILSFLQGVIEPAQHREGQDDLLELALFESTVEQTGNRPQETDDIVEFGGFIHGISRLMGR